MFEFGRHNVNPEVEKERAWQDHCLKRMNTTGWQLEEIEGRGSSCPDGAVVNIEDRRR
jgi:hypothetical protein